MVQAANRRAVVYARVSGREQDDKLSIEGQLYDCQRYAERVGLRIVRSFQDVGSGLSTKQRPEFERMVKYVLDRTNGVTDVIFFDLGRFTRRNLHFYEYTEKLEEGGISLHSAVEGRKYDQDSALSWKVKAIFNEDQSRSTSYHTKRGQRAATRNGYYIGIKAPWGYERYYITVGKEQHAKLRPHPEEWPHCLKLWAMASNGFTPLDITKDFNSQGIPGPSGSRWKDDTVRYILKNEHYTGRTYRGKTPVSRLPGPHEPQETTFGEDAHPAAVSGEDFTKIQMLLASRHKSQGSPRSHSSPNVLSDMVKCGSCADNGIESNMTVSSKDGVRRLQCARKKKQGKGACGGKNIRMDRLLDAVLARMMDHILTPEVIREQIRSAAAESAAYLAAQENRRANIQERLKVVEKEIDNLTGVLKAQGTKHLRLDSLLDSLDQLEAEKQNLNWEMGWINETTQEAHRFMSDPEGVIATAMDLRTYTEAKDDRAIRELVRTVIDTVKVYPDYGEIYYVLPVSVAGSTESCTTESVPLTKTSSRANGKSHPLDGLTGVVPRSDFFSWDHPRLLGACGQVTVRRSLVLRSLLPSEALGPGWWRVATPASRNRNPVG